MPGHGPLDHVHPGARELVPSLVLGLGPGEARRCEAAPCPPHVPVEDIVVVGDGHRRNVLGEIPEGPHPEVPLVEVVLVGVLKVGGGAYVTGVAARLSPGPAA